MANANIQAGLVQGGLDEGQPAAGERPVLVAYKDAGGLIKIPLVDAAGNLNVSVTSVLAGTSFQVEGKQPPGAAIAENPILIAGENLGNVKLLHLSTLGSVIADQGLPNTAGTNSWPVQGAAASGAVPVGNPLLLGAVDPAGGTTVNSLQVSSAATPNLRVGLYGTSTQATVTTSGSDGSATGTGNLQTQAYAYGFNGTSWDRTRHNTDVTLLASASRTTTQNSGGITTYNARGINVYVNITAVGTGSITLNILGVDPVSGSTYTILASAALVANAFTVYKVYPGGAVTANVSANDHLPRVIQVNVVANNANAVTYSVGYTLLY